MDANDNNYITPNIFADGKPDLMTEEELIEFLRIPSVTTATDYHNVIYNLIRFRDLPRIQISRKLLFPRKAILKWINEQTIKN